MLPRVSPLNCFLHFWLLHSYWETLRCAQGDSHAGQVWGPDTHKNLNQPLWLFGDCEARSAAAISDEEIRLGIASLPLGCTQGFGSPQRHPTNVERWFVVTSAGMLYSLAMGISTLRGGAFAPLPNPLKCRVVRA